LGLKPNGIRNERGSINVRLLILAGHLPGIIFPGKELSMKRSPQGLKFIGMFQLPKDFAQNNLQLLGRSSKAAPAQQLQVILCVVLTREDIPQMGWQEV